MSHSDFEFEDDEIQSSSRPSLEDVLEALRSGGDSIPAMEVLYGLSDLSEADVERLQPIYRGLDTTYRRILMQMLVDISENNYEVDYEAVGLMGLGDSDPEVRQFAIEVLAEYDSTYVMNRLMKLAQADRSMDVRAEAARALGRFVLAGELGDISESNFNRVQDCVIGILNNTAEPVEIRARALEAIANCSNELVTPAISAAYRSEDEVMRISAVTAMGNSSDERWERSVMKELESGNQKMRTEAARAAGELQLQEATPHLIRLVQEGSRESREVAINALGELGNKEAMRTLNHVLDDAVAAEDEDLVALIENAMGNASLASGKLMLMEVDPDE
jgi:HEAT repeat protein